MTEEQLGAFLMMRGIMWLVYLAVTIVMIISMWKIYTKAGEKGWKYLIPIYSQLTMLKFVGKPKWWIWPTAIIPIVVLTGYMCWFFFNYANLYAGATVNPSPMIIWLLVLLATAIVGAVYGIKTMIALCDCFGASRYFVLGFIFLPVIFYPILAFGDYRYTPPGSIPPHPIEPTTYPED